MSARLPGSSDPISSCRLSTRAPAHGGHAEYGFCREGRRVAQHELLELGGGVHLVEHVEIVVAGGTVRPDPHRDSLPRAPPPPAAARATPSFMLLCGLCAIPAPLAAMRCYVLVRQVDRVREHRPGPKRANRAEGLDDSHTGSVRER